MGATVDATVGATVEATRARRPKAVRPRPELGPEADVLDRYIADLTGTATATAQEQKELARRARNTRLSHEEREAARDALVAANLRFAFSIAKQYQHRGLPLEDLVGEANAGLVRAVDKYDPDVGVNFISYAVWWIRQAIAAALANTGHAVRLPTNRVHEHARVGRARETLRQTLGREPTDAELAHVAGLTAEMVRSLRNLTLVAESLDEPLRSNGRGREGRTLGETLDALAVQEGADSHDPEQGVEEESRRAALARLLDTLPPRDRKVLVMYFGLEGNRSMTLNEIAEVFGLTRERIRQLRDRAIERLRTEEAEKLMGEWAA